ncbi:MAG: hypothetical protein LUF26_09015, partial [Firmicutes bacterium]|nr:hypothetical protein [Bacillota bacterium]
TYEYLDGTTSTVYVKIGDSVTLAATSYGWTITGTDSYSSGATYTPTGDVTFTEAAYTVTYYDAGGSLLETVYVPIGDTITLRATDYVWEDTSGNTYSSGAAYTPTADIAFTEHDETLTVTYTLNYPSVMQAPAASKTYYNQGYYGYTADMPYITEAGSGSTTYSYTAHQSQLFTTASPSEQIVEALMIRWDNTRYYAVYFDGWTVTVNNTTYTYAAGEEIDWATLTTLAGTGGTISFTGSWTYDTTSTVNFFVRWNNASVGSSTNLFTDPVFTTYVYNGTASYDITDSDTTNDDNSYASNLLVRALAEYQSDSIPYLYDFPDDEYTFAQLKSMIDDDTTLIVDGIDVKISELTTDYYEIRWYNFKYDSLDGWHINGKLVRKTGDINIYKTFEGNADSIADDKADFYITATSQLDGDSETFDLTNYTDYDAATDTYHWVLEDVTYKEEWVISEKDVDVGATYSRYTSYRVVDSTGNESQTGTGTSVTVYGMVYQKDIGEDEALNVYFTNIYTAEDTIIVRKVDSMTGNTMSGSGFEVYRYGTEKVTFDVDADGTYVENTGGTGAEDTLTINNGYVTVEVDRDYMLEFRETLTPTGYEVPTEYIQLDNSTGSLAVTQGGDYAEYSNGVLTVYNTPTTADITVTKTWTSDATPADITLWLMSDNRTAAALLPNWTGSSEVTLTASAGVWTYTWDDVPLYADGAALNWSVLETKIGSESISSGSFDSYIVTYTGPTTTTDSSGTHISIGITNDTKSVRLRVTKIDGDTGEYLSGAVFRLRLVDDNLEIDSSFDALTLTSGTDGTLTFTDIPYGTYLLTETTAPDGYSLISDAVYVTINTDDTVSVSGSYGGYAYVDSANAYSIIVENYEAVLLPATGGHRTLYSISGAMMMFAALVYITLKKRGWTS